MSSLKFEIILFLIGVGFGPTAPLTQVALQNTVPIHDLGAAIGTMNFARTLIGHDADRRFRRDRAGAMRRSDAAPAVRSAARSSGIASVATFANGFLAIAGTLAIAFLAVILLEEKPLGETLPGPGRGLQVD